MKGSSSGIAKTRAGRWEAGAVPPTGGNLSRNVVWLLAGLLWASGSQAQSEPVGQGTGWMRRERAIRQIEAENALRTIKAARRQLAHERMPKFPREGAAPDHCPVASVAAPVRRADGKPVNGFPAPRLFAIDRSPARTDPASATESPADLFEDSVSGPVVQSRCIHCHVAGGLSGHTRLVFVPAGTSGHLERNLRVLSTLVTETEGGSLILAKVQGIGHGGGIQLPAGSEDFRNFERLVSALGETVSTGGGLTPESIFDGVAMASPTKTLRRAALLLAGRLPTPAESAAVRRGGVPALRQGIRSLMDGPKFHDFLIRASNDRLLTDRQLNRGTLRPALTREFVVLARKHVQLLRTALARGYRQPRADPDFRRWKRALDYGLARAPLELIAHVIENDRPYPEILTADYVMANSVTAEAFGSSTEFVDESDPTEFQPSRISAYYRTDESKKEELSDVVGRIIHDPGNLLTEYPHAGILNTNAFLKRYPSTDTSRNRARSRWTYYHFLGVDVEKAASRTTDPVALADRDNPTLKNAACTVCHRIMDPVAGTFQNYGDTGLYKDQLGGLDSLPQAYKLDSAELYRDGDRWYRDMLPPGFGTARVPDPDRSLQWLAEQIVADSRFAVAAVRFWWQAVMGAEVTPPPENPEDPGSAAQLLAATAQQAEVERIAELFRQGIEGGEPYNGKDLLAELFLSPWFQAESLVAGNPVQRQALRHAGARRLLTPEELARKTEALTGYVWGRQLWKMTDRSKGIESSFLNDSSQTSSYGILYGGIDSDGIITRTREMTSVMMAVARTHAAEISCPIVWREFFYWPSERRLLFDGIDRFATPDSPEGSAAIRTKLVDLHAKLLGVEVATDSPDVEDAFELFADVWRQQETSEGGYTCGGFGFDIRYWEGLVEQSIDYSELGSGLGFHWDKIFRYRARIDHRDPNGTIRPWVVVLSYMLSDYRYLHL